MILFGDHARRHRVAAHLLRSQFRDEGHYESVAGKIQKKIGQVEKVFEK